MDMINFVEQFIRQFIDFFGFYLDTNVLNWMNSGLLQTG
jgi:hypothetical protein